MKTDDRFAERFLSGQVDASEFPHERHVRVAWTLSRRYPPEEAFAQLVEGIQGITRRGGRPEAYHETITRAWFELISQAERLEQWPELFDKSLIDRYYSRERLAAGRDQWLEPDLHPLRLPPPEPVPPTPPPPPLSLADVLRRVPVAVGVVSAHDAGAVHATTTSSLASVSREPTLVSICLTNESRALRLLRESKRFAISLLAAGQGDLAAHFADPERPSGAAQFATTPHHMSRFGPMIDTAAAWLGCDVHALHRCGDHHIVIGEVCFADACEKRPLVRHDGSYR